MKESLQLTLAKEVYSLNKQKIKEKIIDWADGCLSVVTNGYDYEGKPIDYEILEEDFFDFLIELWDDCSNEYFELISKLGNENDETTFQNQVLIDTLKEKDYKKYEPLIIEFERINREGL